MEFEEIKKAWVDLNDRLGKAEAFNKRIIEDMLNSHHQSAKEKLMKYEQFYTIVPLLCIGLCTLIYFAGAYPLGFTILINVVMLLAAIWQIYKIYLLRQMDISTCSTSELLGKAVRFKVITKLRTIVGMVLLVPILVLMFVLNSDFLKPEILTGMVVGIVVGLVIGLTSFFRNLKDIDKLVKSYKDIMEFRNE